jgi:hypothetical protein
MRIMSPKLLLRSVGAAALVASTLGSTSATSAAAAKQVRPNSAIDYQCPAQPKQGLRFDATPFATVSYDPEAASAADPLQWCCGVCMSSLIRGGCEPACCTAWTFDSSKKTCALHTDWRGASSSNHAELTSGLLPSAAPRTRPPPPPPAKQGSQRNIIVVLTDDQDLRLNSMQAMPHAQRLLNQGGANLTNFWVNTPICCPSRATLLSGRFQHNNRVDGVNPEPCSLYDLPSCGCMRQNTSYVDNPAFWDASFVPALHSLGYTTGLFGKVLNDMVSYGCDNISGLPPGVDRQFMMCTHTFFNCSWADDETVVHTGDAPEDYTTSIVGNKTIDWIKSVVAKGPTHPPFFAWVGPHAPHLPSTPAPWYADHPIGLNQVRYTPFCSMISE